MHKLAKHGACRHRMLPCAVCMYVRWCHGLRVTNFVQGKRRQRCFSFSVRLVWLLGGRDIR